MPGLFFVLFAAAWLVQAALGGLRAMGGAFKTAGRLVGVISDTHGLLRPAAAEALKGVEMILHAGDVGGPHVLEALADIAPVVAVRGNNDRGEWAEALPLRQVVSAGAVRLLMLHDLKELDVNPASEGFGVVISGHSHKPSAVEREGVLYLNPGSAGPRRFRLPVTLARLRIRGGAASAELVDLAA
jgi:putative phosphoesterase